MNITAEMEALPQHTSRGPVPSDGPDSDVSEVGYVQRPVRGDHKRGRAVQPSVFSVAVARLVAVAVSVVLSRQGRRTQVSISSVHLGLVYFTIHIFYV